MKGGKVSGLLVAVIVLTFGMNMVARGFTETFGLFLLPVQEALGASRSAMTGVYSVFMLVHGLAAPMAGHLFDRWGARVLYGLGLVCLGGGFVLAGWTTEIWHYYVTVGLLGGIAVAALGMVPATGLLSRWFTHHLSSVMGLAYASLGAGVLVILPLTQVLLEHLEWRTTYFVLGGIVLALLVPVMLLPLGTLTRGSEEWRRKRADADDRTVRWTLRTALRTPAFWGLFNVYFFTAYAAYSILPQAVAYLVENGFDALTAASAVGITGMLSVFGMVAVGWLAGRFGRRRTVSVSYLFSLTGITAIILVAQIPELWLVYGFVIFFGLSQGARGPIVTTMTAQLFPGGGMGSIYGAITLGLGVGAAVGSWVSGLLHDLTGGYFLSFGLAWGASALGLAQFYLIRALADEQPIPKARETEAQETETQETRP